MVTRDFYNQTIWRLSRRLMMLSLSVSIFFSFGGCANALSLLVM
jgi:hypothetical protein